MAVTFGFYNSVTGDRVYNAVHMSALFDGLIHDGIFATYGQALVVRADTPISMDVIVGIGRAWFNHTWTLNDADLSLTISTPHVTYNRYDAVILEVDSSQGVRANSIKIVEGTPAAVPEYPTLTNTETVHQYPLAYVLVIVGASSITAANITSVVGTTPCPFVTGIIDTINISGLIAQWSAEFDDWMTAEQADFDAWMQNIIDQLSEEAAGNLQLQINDIVDTYPDLVGRQGGSPTDWSVSGNTNYSYSGTVGMQIGSFRGDSSGVGTVTFPTPFAQPPIIFVTMDQVVTALPVTVQILSKTVNGFTCRLVKHLTAAPYHANNDISVGVNYNWMAVGPMI